MPAQDRTVLVIGATGMIGMQAVARAAPDGHTVGVLFLTHTVLPSLMGPLPYDTSRDTFGNNIFAGPLSRTITDAAVMHAAIAGPSDKDPWSLATTAPRPLSPKLSGEDLSAVRIGYVERMANPRVAADVRANTRASLAAWEAMGATVEEVTDPIDWIEYEGRVLYQAGFAVTCAVMQSRDALERVAFEAIEDLHADGVVYAELRFAPQFHMSGGLPEEAIILRFARVGRCREGVHQWDGTTPNSCATGTTPEVGRDGSCR